MEQSIKVSIIVPIHNNEKHLQVCLNSLVEQTMKEIEIICVNDASTDASAEILEEYGQKDQRLQVITYEQNMSASQARKDGCLKSSGEYIMFVDGDDYLLPKACEQLYEEMKRNPVDILHFGSYILNYSYMPQSRIKGTEKFVIPSLKTLTGEEVFQGAFLNKTYDYNLWNKFYNGKMCRRAMAQIEDGSFPKAQDKYAYWVISLEAKSYRGILDKYYAYRFGSGMTGHENLELKLFAKYVAMGKTVDVMERFLEKKGYIEKYNKENEINRKQLLDDVAVNWLRLKKDDREIGLMLMQQFWGFEEIQYVREKEMG